MNCLPMACVSKMQPATGRHVVEVSKQQVEVGLDNLDLFPRGSYLRNSWEWNCVAPGC